MQLLRPSGLDALAAYLQRFIALVGKDRWFKRANHLDEEQRRSPYRWKIVADYHWLELAISFQCYTLAKEGRLLPEHSDMQVRAALHFAATIVEVHSALSPKGKKILTGRLRDALKAETGLAALYLEMDVAQRLAIAGCNLEFPDLDDTGQYDIAFSRGGIVGEPSPRVGRNGSLQRDRMWLLQCLAAIRDCIPFATSCIEKKRQGGNPS